jgi:hypothetical protein
MSQSHEAREVLNAFSVLEDLRGHSVALTLIDSASGRTSGDTAGILTAMLEKIQRIVDVSGSRDRLGVSMDDSDNATHLGRYIQVQKLKMISKHEIVTSGESAGS